MIAPPAHETGTVARLRLNTFEGSCAASFERARGQMWAAPSKHDVWEQTVF